MKLDDIAKGISQHLRHFERTPEINKPDPKYRTVPYYMAGAGRAGNRVMVVYVSYQGPCSLTKDQALAYLTWLDSGNIGTHFLMRREEARG